MQGASVSSRQVKGAQAAGQGGCDQKEHCAASPHWHDLVQLGGGDLPLGGDILGYIPHKSQARSKANRRRARAVISAASRIIRDSDCPSPAGIWNDGGGPDDKQGTWTTRLLHVVAPSAMQMLRQAVYIIPAWLFQKVRSCFFLPLPFFMPVSGHFCLSSSTPCSSGSRTSAAALCRYTRNTRRHCAAADHRRCKANARQMLNRSICSRGS